MSQSMTTLKLQMRTRDLIRDAAKRHAMTIDEYLAHLMAEEAWRMKLAEAREAMADPGTEYLRETAEWDTLA